MGKDKACYLPIGHMHNLEHQCRLLNAVFGNHCYLVGSVLYKTDFRDVDIRSILPDDKFTKLLGINNTRLLFMNTVISDWLSARTSLPIDFQFQSQSEANSLYNGNRSFIGIPIRKSHYEDNDTKQLTKTEEKD